MAPRSPSRPPSPPSPPCAALLAGALALGACSEGGPSPAGGPGTGERAGRTLEHAILISLDTLRADHCSLYGYEKPTTPFLSELARRGVVFENHMVSSNNTLASHASIMTGLFPLAHDIEDSRARREALAPGYRTLAEAFAEAGFATASIAAHAAWLGREFGVMQGFERVEADWIDSPACWQRFAEWFDAERPRRSFVFLHSFDVHSDGKDGGNVLPYESSGEHIAGFAPPRPEGFTGCSKNPADGCASGYLRGINAGVEPLPAEHLEYLVGLYDAGVRKQDDDLRLLFAMLEERGLLESSLIVITSDHGEEFMEHGRVLHGGFSDAIMHVPLLVLYPESWGVPARRVAQVTRSIDIAPTLLDCFGLAPIGQGRSLRGVLEGGAAPEGDVLFGITVLRARDEQGEFKLACGARLAFFDLEADPREQVNLYLEPGFTESPRLLAARARIDALRREAVALREGLKRGQSFPPQKSSDDAELVEDLRKLGYVDVGGAE
jgi:arylsulfatase A-like enzyme